VWNEGKRKGLKKQVQPKEKGHLHRHHSSGTHSVVEKMTTGKNTQKRKHKTKERTTERNRQNQLKKHLVSNLEGQEER